MPPYISHYQYHFCAIQGKQVLYGDPTEVLREGSEISELTNDGEDPRGMYGVRKHSIQDDEGLRSRGIMHTLNILP